MPCFVEAFPKLHSDFGNDQRRRFCEYLAEIACHSSLNPLADGWLNEFLSSVTDDERTSWASCIGGMLSGMQEEALEIAWRAWIKTYWERRIEGIPVPLSVREASEILLCPGGRRIIS